MYGGRMQRWCSHKSTGPEGGKRKSAESQANPRITDRLTYGEGICEMARKDLRGSTAAPWHSGC